MTGEDRFGDLGDGGSSGSRGASAAERFAELDEREPEQEPRPPAPPRPGGRYSWVVGIAFLIAIAVAGLNAIRTEGPGAFGPGRGEQLPLFAAPLATTGLDKDANVDPDAVCDVDLPDVVNVCRLRDRALAITFMFTRFADCEPQLDRVERIRREFPEVGFIGVIVREPKGDAARLVRRNGWGFPVALDRDGQVSNVYGIGGCPTTVFTRAGGDVTATRVGPLSEDQLRAELRIATRPPGSSAAGEAEADDPER